MPKPFDAATKRLVESNPVDWLRYLGLPGEEGELVETDLTTVTAEADRVLRVHTATPYLAHIEFQSTYDPHMDERVLVYNVLTFGKLRLPVQSLVVLLRPEAEGPGVTGRAGYTVPDSDEGRLELRYRVVRVWEKTPEEALSGGLMTLPLAPLTQVAPQDLPHLIRRMEERIEREAPEEAGILWTTTYLLMGLKYEREAISLLLRGVRQMKESVTYQAILEEGEAIGQAIGKLEGAREVIFRLGAKRFGPPDATAEAALRSLGSLEALEQLAERLLEVENWQELLSPQ